MNKFVLIGVCFLVLYNFLQGSNAAILKGDRIAQSLSSQDEKIPLIDELKSSLQNDKPISEMEGVSIRHTRVERAMKEDVEKGFKEFSEKIGKLPEQITGSFKKFFEDRGISLENIQKFLGDIWNGVEKLIDEIKKAM